METIEALAQVTTTEPARPAPSCLLAHSEKSTSLTLYCAPFCKWDEGCRVVARLLLLFRWELPVLGSTFFNLIFPLFNSLRFNRNNRSRCRYISILFWNNAMHRWSNLESFLYVSIFPNLNQDLRDYTLLLQQQLKRSSNMLKRRSTGDTRFALSVSFTALVDRSATMRA